MSSDAPTPPTPSLSFEPPRGMRDFYPEDMAARQALFEAWRRAARAFGFAPYDACIVESLELLKRKSGEEIVEQIYAFADKSGRALALRPEMTPTLARMIAARQGALVLPLKWYAIAQCFRYERMSRGRKREHYQWNLDIVGAPAVTAEAEILACASQALALLGVPPGAVTLRVSSRALLAELLAQAGIAPPFHPATFLGLDKRGKIDDDAIGRLLREAGLDAAAVQAVFGLLSIRTLEEAAARVGPASPGLASLRALWSLMADYGCADQLCFDLGIVRGLGYYTGMVFEAYDADRQFRALFGGGRYDRLLEDVGGKPVTAVGLGFGDVVITEWLADKGLLTRAPAPTDYAVGYMEDAQRSAARRAARALRQQGATVDLALQPEKAKAFFGRVGRGGFHHALYIGPDDLQCGRARVKHLAERTETEMPLPADALTAPA